MRHCGCFVDTRKPSPYYSRFFVTKWPVRFMFRVSDFKCFGNGRLALRARVTVRPFDKLSALSVIEGRTTSFERIACARSETAP